MNVWKRTSVFLALLCCVALAACGDAARALLRKAQRPRPIARRGALCAIREPCYPSHAGKLSRPATPACMDMRDMMEWPNMMIIHTAGATPAITAHAPHPCM